MSARSPIASGSGSNCTRSRPRRIASPDRSTRVTDLPGEILDGVEARTAADAVDRLEAASGNEPRARIGGHALVRPLLERRAKRVVKRFLGDVEVAEQPDQRGEYAPRFGAIDALRD